MTCEGGKKCCKIHWLSWVLVIIGGLNWGVVSVGLFLPDYFNFGAIHMLLQSLPLWVSGIVYLLIGLSAIIMIIGCRCKSCSTGSQQVQ
ncbi:MAG: DUF378 domain-containing protein [Candidatus Vogelbacteria bacterium]|nr:DUF378 domain-containing protein [Candidatus Vogelbacteria bacterium]